MPDRPPTGVQDADLVQRCLKASPEAWEEFIRKYHAVLEGAVRYTFLRCLYSVPAADVENVIQELYARLYEDDFRRLRSFEARCPLALWLKSMAVRQTLNTIRDEKRRGRFGGGPVDELPLMRAPEAEGGASPEEREEFMRLEILLDQLGPLQRTALKMFYYDGLTYRQISAALGIGVQTVGSLISRARDRLRSLMHRSD